MEEGWGKQATSKGARSLWKEILYPELLPARDLICNQFSSRAASVPRGDRRLSASPGCCWQQGKSPVPTTGAAKGMEKERTEEKPPAPGKEPRGLRAAGGEETGGREMAQRGDVGRGGVGEGEDECLMRDMGRGGRQKN